MQKPSRIIMLWSVVVVTQLYFIYHANFAESTRVSYQYDVSSNIQYDHIRDSKCDFWGIRGTDLTVSNNKVIASSGSPNTSNIYSKQSVSSVITNTPIIKHKWEFNIINTPHHRDFNFKIGIASSIDNRQGPHYMYVDCFSFFCFAHITRIDSKTDNRLESSTHKSAWGINKTLIEGEKFILELDLFLKTLTFGRSSFPLADKILENIDTGEDIRYYVKVSMKLAVKDQRIIQIERYTTYHWNSDSFRSLHHHFEHGLEKISEMLESATIAVDSFTQAIENGNLIQATPLNNLIQVSKLKKFATLQENMGNIEGQVLQLKQSIREAEMSLNQVLNPSCKDYKDWTLTDVIFWINSLEDGRYSSYCDVLKEEFANDVRGSDLPMITREDLKGFGINVFRDRVALVDHFQALTNQETDTDTKQNGKQLP